MYFKNVTNFDFGDAKKFEHMSKVSFTHIFHYDTYYSSSKFSLQPSLC